MLTWGNYLLLVSMVGAVFAATSQYGVLCSGADCQAELTTSVETALSYTNATLAVLVGGYAQSRSTGGDTATFSTETRTFSASDLVASARITDMYISIESATPKVITQCFCDMDSAPCGPAGVQELTSSKVVLVWYSSASSDIGCPVAGNSRLCTKVTLTAAAVSEVYDIGTDVSSITVTNGTYNTDTNSTDTTRHNLYLHTNTRTTPSASVRLTSATLDQSLSHYHYVVKDNAMHRAFVRASDGTLGGAMWWTCSTDGQCTVPPISAFANLFETGDYSTCNAEVPSLLPITTGAAALDPVLNVEAVPPLIKFSAYTGFTSIRVEETRTAPFPIVNVDRIDCIRVADAKVAQLTVSVPSYGYAVVREAVGDGPYIPLKLAGRVTSFQIPTNAASYKVNHGINSKTCSWAEGRMLRVTPLDQFGAPLSMAAAAASYIPPAPGGEEVSLARIYSITISALVIACMAFLVSAYIWRRHWMTAATKKVKGALCCKRANASPAGYAI